MDSGSPVIRRPSHINSEEIREIILGDIYSDAVDWWSCGVTLFQLAWRFHPFSENVIDPAGMKESITSRAIHIRPVINERPELSAELRDFVRKLLVKDPNERLGIGRTGSRDVKAHPWFKDTDWYKVLFWRQQFVVTDAEQSARTEVQCSEDIFKNIPENTSDRTQDEFRDF